MIRSNREIIVSHHNRDSLHILQYDSHWIRWIELVRTAGFKVFVKSHLWVESPSDGKWRSGVFPTSDKNWELWKKPSFVKFEVFILEKIAIKYPIN